MVMVSPRIGFRRCRAGGRVLLPGPSAAAATGAAGDSGAGANAAPCACCGAGPCACCAGSACREVQHLQVQPSASCLESSSEQLLDWYGRAALSCRLAEINWVKHLRTAGQAVSAAAAASLAAPQMAAEHAATVAPAAGPCGPTCALPFCTGLPICSSPHCPSCMAA